MHAVHGPQPNRPLPPEEIPHRLFGCVFGAQDQGWISRKRSDPRRGPGGCGDAAPGFPKEDEQPLDEDLSSIRDLERAIAGLPPDYRQGDAAGRGFRPQGLAAHFTHSERFAWAYALATNQTRVASFMLTKCQGLARFPWLGHTAARHHDYTHKDGKAPGEKGPEVDSRRRRHAARRW